MTLLFILLIGALSGLFTGAILRRVGIIRRLTDVLLGILGAFVVGAMGSGALLEGLTLIEIGLATGGAVALVAAAHLVSAFIRPVHAKYYRR